MRRNDPRLQIITETLNGLIPGATPAFLSLQLTETFPLAVRASVNTWTGAPSVVAERIFTALYGRPRTELEESPLAQAEGAKRARDLGAEVDVLNRAHRQLISAPWYPLRRGDLVHVHYEAGGEVTAFGETYVIGDAGDGLMDMLLLAHTLPSESGDVEGMVGCFAVEASDDPVYTPWFEAGPHRLTIVRDGQVVHGAPVRQESETAAAGTKLAAMTMAAAIREAEQYLERGEPELALARLRSDVSLAPCGTPGPMADMADCARPIGHRPPCSPDADLVVPPHECPALPEQLHAVVTVGAKVEDVHLAGLYEDREAAVDHCAGFTCYAEEHSDQYVKRYAHGGMLLELPGKTERHGVQLAVVVPLQVLPDPREDDWQADEARAAADPDYYRDYGKDLDDEDDYADGGE